MIEKLRLLAILAHPDDIEATLQLVVPSGRQVHLELTGDAADNCESSKIRLPAHESVSGCR
jgi:LmbE family N-acetylglucosaminyl deacetylase